MHADNRIVAPVDATDCDREAIHVPGLIQPFGFLLEIGLDWRVRRASANAGAFLGLAMEAVLGAPVARLVTAEALALIGDRIATLDTSDRVERLFHLNLREGRGRFDMAIHRAGTAIVLEAEPAGDDRADSAMLVCSLTASLGATRGMDAFLQEATVQMRLLTGFDRVDLYRFDHTGAGEVVAEALRPGVNAFLGLHFPASDIPAQARALYVRNPFRIIADVDGVLTPIVAAPAFRGAPLDQSLSLLRAVSPVHIAYLRNMGVKASLSVSIVIDGALWGLFACHHLTPRLPSFGRRTAAELFGRMFALALESRERAAFASAEAGARELLGLITSAVARDGEQLADATLWREALAGGIQADGLGVSVGGRSSLSGVTPSPARFEQMLAQLAEVARDDIFVTDHVATALPGDDDGAVAGLLAIPLSRGAADYLVLFRRERATPVRWAGDPVKPSRDGAAEGGLRPRSSFSVWMGQVAGHSTPFSAIELRYAELLRGAFIEVLVSLSRIAIAEQDRARHTQTTLIGELNHRVRNILGLIQALVSQSARESLSTADFVASLEGRVNALAAAHDQLTDERRGPARLISLIRTECEAWLGVRDNHVRLSGADVLLSPVAFTSLALVLHEMITNAATHGALSAGGWVAIDWSVETDGGLSLYWREHGGPTVAPPERRGFGTGIIEGSIPFELGGRVALRYPSGGLEADFHLPAACVVGLSGGPAASGAAEPRPDPARILEGLDVLLVEDNLIIALGAEEALEDMGARAVRAAATVARAQAIIAEGWPQFAVLDVHLGSETSLPIAERLVAQGTPFVFATGYGDGFEPPEACAHVPVVRKPYDAERLAAAIATLTPPVRPPGSRATDA